MYDLVDREPTRIEERSREYGKCSHAAEIRDLGILL